ncbi:biotin/lipoyl-containing protein, partial [Kineococcus gynurae]|uniref:biotin/lipoyl-containing protein n=1 Tax=Kineococcus gynurae TaxID=452979 RepID=UPI003D7C546C
MANTVQMPALGESVTEGTVTRWLKSVGDTVEVDEPLLEVSTDKVDTEIPSPFAGTLQEILVEEDETVDVGADLARIGDGAAPESGGSDAPAEETSAQEAPAEEPAAEQASAQPEPEESTPAPSSSGSGGSGGSGGEAVTMPALGESVTEGTVTRWLKSVGDAVEIDEPLLEVSTDKVDTEIPSPVAGTLLEILVGEDETVAVGAELARVGDGSAPSSSGDSTGSASAGSSSADSSSESPSTPESSSGEETLADEAEERAAAEKQAEASTQPSSGADKEPEAAPAKTSTAVQSPAAAPAAPTSEDKPAEATGGSTYVTPLVRKMAKDLGVDLSSVTGTGVGGRVRKQDVQEAADQAKKAAEAASAAAGGAGRGAGAGGGGAARARPARAPRHPPGSLEPAWGVGGVI